MKKLRINIDKWFDMLDKRWQSLPVCKQHKFMLYFFAGYLLLTAGVIFKVWYDMAKSDNRMVIEHLANRVSK
jgi:uncharacterized membrane protein